MKRNAVLLAVLALVLLFFLPGCGDGGDGGVVENGNGGEIRDGGSWVTEEGRRIDDPYFFDVSVIRLDDGTYRMYGEKRGNVESYRSRDGLVWQKEEGVRLQGAAFPSVVRTDDGGFRMYYVPSANTGEPQNRIKSAVSSDGLSFQVESGARYVAGSALEERLSGPRVLKADEDLYRMYFTAASGSGDDELVLILSASSPDGLTFTREEGVRIDPREPPLVGKRAAHAYPLQHAGGVRLYFAGAHAQGFGGILSAESGDGLDFTVNPFPEIAEKERGLGPQDPCVVPVPGGLRMYYGIYRGPEVVEESAIYSAFREGD